MTLVLAFGGDQISSSSLFMRNNSNSSMPCVFESDAFEGDFESALMRDWASEINDYEMSTEDSSIKAPSDINDLKRKSSAENDEVPDSLSKKPRLENKSVPSLGLTCSPEHESSSSGSDSPSPSSEEDEDDFPPRRRGLQMWNSRQWWKDERKKVLKMSVTKLAEIEDPELCLWRSVLMNNTIRRLHGEIRGERQAKLRHRQQLQQPPAHRFDERLDLADDEPVESTPAKRPSSAFYDDSSCDEIFGISEDFLRVTIPDRRASSPLPVVTSREVEPPQTQSAAVTTAGVTTCPMYSGSSSSPGACDTDSSFRPPAFPSAPLRRPLAAASNSGQQCATQFRTHRDFGDVSFPPRVPILDSVVYHSLLASLESS